MNAQSLAMSVFAGVVLASLAASGPLYQRLVGPRGKVVAALALLAFVPLVMGAALARIDAPVVWWWWGARVEAAGSDAALRFYGAGMLGGLAAMSVAARPWPSFERGLAVAAPAIFGAGVMLAGCASVRSMVSTDPARFVASIDFVGSVPRGSSDNTSMAGASDSHELRAANGVRVRRHCYARSDAILPSAPAFLCSVDVTMNDGRTPATASFDVGDSSTLTLWHDAADGVFVLDEDGRRARAFDDSGTPVSIPMRAVAHRLAPPRAWTLIALAGLFSAAVALWLARLAERTATAIAGGTPGTYDGAGWIHIAGDAPLRKPEDASVPAGPVVVIAGSVAEVPTSAYRLDPSRPPASIIVGAKADILARLRNAASERRAFAVVAVALTSAPLIAALVRGLVL